MRVVVAGCAALTAAILVGGIEGRAQQAQERPPDPPAELARPSTTSGDPRIGLKPGLHDAGEATPFRPSSPRPLRRPTARTAPPPRPPRRRRSTRSRPIGSTS